MKSDKTVFIFIITILLLHHFKDVIKEIIIENIAGDNYKLEGLLLHSIFVDENMINEEYGRLEIKPLKIFRIYSMGMLLSMGIPIIIPLIRLL